LHHGIERPDTAQHLEHTLRLFVDRLTTHGCLSRHHVTGRVGYSFVHGNWALANSARGKTCGVDNEMQILADTGCYMDCTLPSAPDRSQVPVINAIYQCAHPLSERAPHRSGLPLAVGKPGITLPILLQGPLLVNWRRRLWKIPVPRIENGNLTAEYPPTLERFRLWVSANIHVRGQPSWIFIKLHTHGLIDRHKTVLLGEPMKRFLAQLTEEFNDYCRVHFVSAREAANIIFAAVDGQTGDPGQYRDYLFHSLSGVGVTP
jgi:hypothetical protein